MYAVIRAGGVGARLWPISRNAKPKQFHALTSQKTLLQEAIDRVLDLIPAEQVFVSCNRQTEAILRAELGAVLEHNIIIEPDLRDTAAAVGLETIMIAKHDPTALLPVWALIMLLRIRLVSPFCFSRNHHPSTTR